MARELFVLEEDKQWARQRIAELEQAILDLGPEFHDVFNQSSETYHDNAPFDALRDRQSVLDAELQNLRSVVRDSLPSVPKPKRGRIGIGSTVTVGDEKGKHCTYKIAGDWTHLAGALVSGQRIVSTATPVARELLGKKIGEKTRFGKIITIE